MPPGRAQARPPALAGPAGAPDPRIAAVAAAVRASRKYATVAEDVVRRLSADALCRHASQREAERAVRAKLHQIYGAYLTRGDLARVARQVQALPERPDPDTLRQAARAILARHASSAERLPLLDGLYARLLAPCSLSRPPRRILDLGCGLHPFALPWMGLAPDVEYDACDLDECLIGLVSLFLRRAGQPGLARTWDLLSAPPDGAWRADVIFLLKALPCLEQQECGAARRVLRSCDAPLVVVSFPARSLGGREKGMRVHYSELMTEITHSLDVTPHTITFPTETFYLLVRS
jgi:16S rRNA (guanine(1405)-N(7))-methyltransferase